MSYRSFEWTSNNRSTWRNLHKRVTSVLTTYFDPDTDASPHNQPSHPESHVPDHDLSPIGRLPHELLLHVFESLETEIRRDALRRICSVCKVWRNLATRPLYAEVDLTHPPSIVRFLRAIQPEECSRHHAYLVNSVTLKSALSLNELRETICMEPPASVEAVLEVIFGACSNLKRLTVDIPALPHSQHVVDQRIGISARIATLEHLFLRENLPVLSKAITDGSASMPALESLIIVAISPFRPSPRDQILSFPNLTKLTLMYINTQELVRGLFPIIAHHLEELALRHCHISPPGSAWPALPRLRSLSMQFINLDNADNMELLHHLAPRLRKLVLGNCQLPSCRTTTSLAWPSSFPILEGLEINVQPRQLMAHVTTSDPALAELITLVAPSLRHLEISGMQAPLTQTIVEAFPRLATLQSLTLGQYYVRDPGLLPGDLRATYDLFANLPPNLRELRMKHWRSRYRYDSQLAPPSAFERCMPTCVYPRLEKSIVIDKVLGRETWLAQWLPPRASLK